MDKIEHTSSEALTQLTLSAAETEKQSDKLRVTTADLYQKLKLADAARAEAQAALRSEFLDGVRAQTREFKDLKESLERVALLPGEVEATSSLCEATLREVRDGQKKREEDEKRIQALEKDIDGLRAVVQNTWATERNARHAGDELTLQKARSFMQAEQD